MAMLFNGNLKIADKKKISKVASQFDGSQGTKHMLSYSMMPCESFLF